MMVIDLDTDIQQVYDHLGIVQDRYNHIAVEHMKKILIYVKNNPPMSYKLLINRLRLRLLISSIYIREYIDSFIANDIFFEDEKGYVIWNWKGEK
jgi:hypothetical protein